MTSPGEMFACLLTREAELGFHELIYLRVDLVLVLVYLLRGCVVCQVLMVQNY